MVLQLFRVIFGSNSLRYAEVYVLAKVSLAGFSTVPLPLALWSWANICGYCVSGRKEGKLF